MKEQLVNKPFQAQLLSRLRYFIGACQSINSFLIYRYTIYLAINNLSLPIFVNNKAPEG